MGLPPLVSYSYMLIRTTISMLWIRFCRWLISFAVKPTTRHNQKAVIIGDGLAFGVGDWVVLTQPGGVASNLMTQINRKRENRIRTWSAWEVFNCGEPTATTEDWLPSAVSGASKPSYFDKTFGTGPYADAQLVIIMLGTQDILQGKVGVPEDVLEKPVPLALEGFYPEEDLCQTVQNIRTICRVLLESNPRRRIVLCDVLNGGQGYRVNEGGLLPMTELVNRQIRDLFSPDNPVNKGSSLHQRMLWQFMSPPKVLGGMRTENKNADGIHLSAKGYRRMAEFMAQRVSQAMTQVEFSYRVSGMEKSQSKTSQAQTDEAS